MPAPLDADRLRAAACAPGGGWARLDVVARTGSTNADLLAGARDPVGAPDRTVLAAEHQESGRGRRTRLWEARPSEGLTVSMLLRPREVPPPARGWAPLLAGLALVGAVAEVGSLDVDAALKWPNDLLLGPERRKGAGILVEADGAAPDSCLVVGIGLNVTTPRSALPEGATSLAAELPPAHPPPDRTALLAALLAHLAALDDHWRAARGDVVAAGLHARYREHCATLGQRVRVLLPGDRVLEGLASDVDPTGRLLVRDDRGDTTVVSAGDVVHVRPSPG